MRAWNLNEDERASILRVLLEEAIEAGRKIGCTCDPTMVLTEETFGRYNLPAWMAQHEPGCKLADPPDYVEVDIHGHRHVSIRLKQ